MICRGIPRLIAFIKPFVSVLYGFSRFQYPPANNALPPRPNQSVERTATSRMLHLLILTIYNTIVNDLFGCYFVHDMDDIKCQQLIEKRSVAQAWEYCLRIEANQSKRESLKANLREVLDELNKLMRQTKG